MSVTTMSGKAKLAPILSVTTALAFLNIRATAQEAVPGDKVYYLHSSSQGNCPALKWHIVADSAGVLSGVVTSEDGKLMVMLAGTINPPTHVDRDAKQQTDTAEVSKFSMLGTRGWKQKSHGRCQRSYRTKRLVERDY